jgi:hypothetical protein
LIARCVHNSGSSLGEPSRGSFYTLETVFDLELGKEYIVLGLGVFETVLLALVCDETGRPNWLPIGLFALEATVVPAHWEFGVVDGLAASGGDASNRWVARWGYPELVHDDRHSDALIEQDPLALAIFARELHDRYSGPSG